MGVDHLAHRIQHVLLALHAALQRDQPTRSLPHATSTQEQTVIGTGSKDMARALAGDRDETAALAAIALMRSLTATSWALTTLLTPPSAYCTQYTLCCSETSPLPASHMHHQRKSRP